MSRLVFECVDSEDLLFQIKVEVIHPRGLDLQSEIIRGMARAEVKVTSISRLEEVEIDIAVPRPALVAQPARTANARNLEFAHAV
jgi:hypothetical protein